MAEYGDYCPVNMATEVVADRWTPLIIRELLLGSTRFNEIARALPGISRTLLVQRLRHLERRGVVETWPSPNGRGREYRLTDAGRDLESVIDAMSRWAIEWLFEDLKPDTVPPTTLMWWMHQRVEPRRFPPHRTVVEFRFRDAGETIWLMLDRGTASVCVQHPGFEPDVVASATTATFSEVFSGVRSWRQSVLAGDIEVHGMPQLTRSLPTWFLWSPWAKVSKERAQRALAAEGAARGTLG
ncbi:helix-turn-helix domain-containing protein [Terrabacter sp. NPDC080008]|uniref:winged helix-turn-helix transcriptional regulator n=1 Tax=Terrabacter sp. NPDC080008 TaxID=3155176 RepID=UPI00344B867A